MLKTLFFLLLLLGFNCHSANANWIQFEPVNEWKQEIHIHSVFLSTNSNKAWAVGEYGANGLLLYSQDAGKSWKPPQEIPDLTGIVLRDVQFTDENHGFLVGDKGVILASEDSGKHWVKQENPDNAKTDLFSVHFPDLGHAPLVGWAAGSDGIILTTNNGGKNWQIQPKPSWWQNPLHSIHFIDEKHGYAVGENGRILVTRNGGDKWDSEQNPDPNKNTLNSVFFVDSRHGYAVGDNGTLLVKEGQQGAWQLLDPPEIQRLI